VISYDCAGSCWKAQGKRRGCLRKLTGVEDKHMTRFALVVFVLSLSFVSVYGQTSSDLEKKYGPPIKAYEIRLGVLLTVKPDPKGQVCEMVLENRHKREFGFDLDDSLTDQMVEQLIDELVPASERGAKKTPYGWSMNLGQNTQTDYGYENVEIVSAGTRFSKHMSVYIKWKNRQCK
jgi:hypothetical protein